MIHDGLHALIAANAPLWAAEAEVVRSYWDSPVRTRETDLLWLLRQCYKEYWDGFVPPFDRLQQAIEGIDRQIDRRKVLDHARTLAEELAHYCAFADAYEALRVNDEPSVHPDLLKSEGNWPENVTLVELRAEHKRLHGELGRRAHFFTEGGYCTLYSEGMKLRGRGPAEDKIADACALVFDDEFGHMLFGIAGLGDHGLTDADWALLQEMTVVQMQLRIEMRNAQFSYPVPEDRIRRLKAGICEPMDFDWERAGLEAPKT
jgi:hypothetical protein